MAVEHIVVAVVTSIETRPTGNGNSVAYYIATTTSQHDRNQRYSVSQSVSIFI